MKITIHHAHHPHLSPDHLKWVEEKMSHLTRFADRLGDESSSMRVDLAYHEGRKSEGAHECSVTFFVPHDTLRAEAYADTIEAAVDEVLDKMKSQIDKYKHKEHRMGKRHT